MAIQTAPRRACSVPEVGAPSQVVVAPCAEAPKTPCRLARARAPVSPPGGKGAEGHTTSPTASARALAALNTARCTVY